MWCEWVRVCWLPCSCFVSFPPVIAPCRGLFPLLQSIKHPSQSWGSSREKEDKKEIKIREHTHTQKESSASSDTILVSPVEHTIRTCVLTGLCSHGWNWPTSSAPTEQRNWTGICLAWFSFKCILRNWWYPLTKFWNWVNTCNYLTNLTRTYDIGGRVWSKAARMHKFCPRTPRFNSSSTISKVVAP